MIGNITYTLYIIQYIICRYFFKENNIEFVDCYSNGQQRALYVCPYILDWNWPILSKVPGIAVLIETSRKSRE